MTAGRDDVLRTVEGIVGARVVTVIADRSLERFAVRLLLDDLGAEWWSEPPITDGRFATWRFYEIHGINPETAAWATRVRKHRERAVYDLAAQGRQVTVAQLERDGHGAWWTPAFLDAIEVALGRELGVPADRALDEYLARRRATPDPPKPPLLPGSPAGVPLWLVAAAAFATGAGLAVVGWLTGAAGATWFLP